MGVFDWVSSQLASLGYSGIIFLLMLENLVLPLPSEALLPFIGYLVFLGDFNLYLAIIAATLGSLIGAMIMYEVSRIGGRRMLRRYGKYFMLNEEHLVWSEGWFRRFGDKAIFFGRLIPVVRQLISIPAGTTEVHRGKFLAYTFAGALIWNSALIAFGYFLGQEWHLIDRYTQPIDVIVLVIIIGFVGWFLFKELEKRTFLKYVRPRLIKGSKRLFKRARRRV